MGEEISRRQFVDKYSTIKGITILFVVSIHVLYKFHNHNMPKLMEVFNYIIGFSVPLFMMFGGFFLTSKLENFRSAKELKIIFCRIFKRILIPYYIFVIILFFFQLLTNRPLSILPFVLIDANTHGLYFIIIYIYAYIFSGLMFYILNVFFEKINYIVLFIIIPLISLIFFPVSNLAIKYFPDSSVAGALPYISYFVFGFPIALFCRKISLLNSKSKYKLFIILCLFFLIYTICLYIAREVYGHFLIISDHPPTVFRLVYSAFVFMFLYILFDLIEMFNIFSEKIALNKFGDQSLFIFFIHPYFIYLLPTIFNIFFKDIIYTNYFIFPWITFSYLITYLSLSIFNILPLRCKSIFSR